jgi:nucleotide-binding universal stress UspA family protein
MNGQVCPIAKMERLLVATDGSEFSKSAVREAINLARICSSKLIAVSVVNANYEYATTVPQVIERAEKEAADHLESVRNMASKEGVECETVVHLSEEPHQDIVNDAEKNQVNMIILSTHGRTGFKRLMMGSVTAKVVGHAPCNVLIIPLDAGVDCKKILLATDGSVYSEMAAREAVSMAKLSAGRLLALSVAKRDENIPVAKESVNVVREFAEREGIAVETLSLIGEPYEVIVKTAEQENAGLVVLGSHGRTGIERLLMGSVTERVIGHSKSPVLVVRKPS